MILKAQGIRKSYEQLEVLRGIDLEVEKGEIVSIIGASGAGKTTLLHILSTLDKPDEGQVFFDGVAVESLKEKQIANFRNKKIGFVFQFHHLLDEFSALENVCIPAYIQGMGKSESEKKAKELLELLGLANRSNHKPCELSGGENQRVAISRALMNDPAVVFADEPTGNLDSKTKLEINDLFFHLREVLGQTFVVVTHDNEFAKTTDRVIQMKDGLIVS